jgi:hypothetical protein
MNAPRSYQRCYACGVIDKTTTIKTTAIQPPAASTPHAVSRWPGLTGLFVAPVAAVTALCLYFGYRVIDGRVFRRG